MTVSSVGESNLSQNAPLQVRDRSIVKLAFVLSIIAITGLVIASMYLFKNIPANNIHEVVVMTGTLAGVGAVAIAKTINWRRLFFNANSLKKREFFVKHMQADRKSVESYFSYLVKAGCISGALKAQIIEHVELKKACLEAKSAKFSMLLKCNEQFNNIVRMIDHGHAAKPGYVVKI